MHAVGRVGALRMPSCLYAPLIHLPSVSLSSDKCDTKFACFPRRRCWRRWDRKACIWRTSAGKSGTADLSVAKLLCIAALRPALTTHKDVLFLTQ